jgi:ArsR family transcriptional regulator, virulence genes transcriptional regulator
LLCEVVCREWLYVFGYFSGLTKGTDVVKLVSMIRNKERAFLREAQADTKIFEMQAEICQTLANPKRLQILSLLKKGELSVGEMVKAMSIAKANLSQHLSVMRQKGILVTRREGTTIYYRLARPKITEACAIMREILMDSLEDQEKLSKRIREGDQGSKASGRGKRKIEKGV